MLRMNKEFYDKLSEMILFIDAKKKEIIYTNQCAAKILWHDEERRKVVTRVLAGARGELIRAEICGRFFELYVYDEPEDVLLVVGKSNHHLATLDRLTGLANSEYFYELAQDIIENQWEKTKLVFVYFNIDNFKVFNSEHGYEAGDRALKWLADIIFETFTKYVVSRTSNDHFVVLTDQENLMTKIQHIYNTTQQTKKNERLEVRVGIYEYEEGVSVTLAHDYAKLACDMVRHNYSTFYNYYDDSLRNKIQTEKYIVDHIDEAVNQSYLTAYYQPIKRVLSGDVCAMECLVRWIDPKMGFLSPADFIPILEKRKLIHKVDMFVLDKVCTDILALKQLGEAVVPVSVNMSRLDFQLIDVYEMVKTITSKYGIAPKMINIEVTESALNDDVEKLVETIAKLHADGFEIWLDDFGSEYSTLNSLQNYKFDLLKIDMKFFENFETNEDARTIIMAISDMAKRLHMRVLAEGIETKAQYEFLNEIGCDKAQGYLICHPLPLRELYGKNLHVEDENEKYFYDAIGRVNFLSPNPLEDYQNADKLYNLVPTAIVELKNNHFHYLYVNKGFSDCLASMGVLSIPESEYYINSDSAKLKIRFKEVASRTRSSHKLESVDFIFKGYQVCVKAKEIAYTNGVQALFVTMFNLSTLDNVKKMEQLETSLTYLYSIYDRVDLIDVTHDTIDNVYLSALYYQTSFKNKNVAEAVKDYAKNEIAPEDQKKFLEFYDMSTIYERIENSGREYIAQTIRTMTQNVGVHLQLYIIIRINDGETFRYMSCVRDVVQRIDHNQYDAGTLMDVIHSSYWQQEILKALDVAVLGWNLATGETYLSAGAYRYTLCHNQMGDILQNQGDLSSVYAEDIPMAIQFFEKTKSGEEYAEERMRLKMVDGTYHWSRLIGLFSYDTEGKPLNILGIIQDVENEQDHFRQSQFLNQMPFAVGVFEVRDGITRKLYTNTAYYDLFEDNRENRDGRHTSFMDCIYQEDRHYVSDAIQSVIKGKDVCSELCRAVTGNGKYKWIRFDASVGKREENYILVYSTFISIDDVIERLYTDEKYRLRPELDDIREKEQRLMRSIPGGTAIYRVKKDGRVYVDYISEGLAKIGGYEDSKTCLEAIQYDARKVIPKDDWHRIYPSIEEAIRDNRPIQETYSIYTKAHKKIEITVTANILAENELAEDDIAVLHAVHTLVSEASKQAQMEQERYRIVLEMLGIAYWEWSAENGVYSSKKYHDYAISEVPSNQIEEADAYMAYVHPDDLAAAKKYMTPSKPGVTQKKVIMRAKMKDGTYRWTEMCALMEVDLQYKPTRIITVMQDVNSEWLRQKKELEIDELTGVYNRRYVEKFLPLHLKEAKRKKANFGLAMIDVDAFKGINDTYGHLAGDEALKKVATILESNFAVNRGDYVARFGGDEFIVVCRGISAELLENRLNSVVQLVNETNFEREPDLTIHVSIGCVHLTELPEATERVLIAAADERLYEAKRSGKNKVVAH